MKPDTEVRLQRTHAVSIWLHLYELFHFGGGLKREECFNQCAQLIPLLKPLQTVYMPLSQLPLLSLGPGPTSYMETPLGKFAEEQLLSLLRFSCHLGSNPGVCALTQMVFH